MSQLTSRLRAGFLTTLAFCGVTVAVMAAPVTTHPRLLIRQADLPGLRARMTDSNDVWVHVRDQVVVKALADWKRTRNAAGELVEPDGTIIPANIATGQGLKAAPEDDIGAHTGNQPMISEQYAMIFAFMALMTKDDPAQAAQHAEYVTAAKECLFKVIDAAVLGHPAPDANGKYPPFRHPGFAMQDRSFAQEAFGLTVDWMYDEFTPLERAKLRKTFLLWANDTWKKFYYSPINPDNLINDPAIFHLATPELAVKRGDLRIALNNHYANHLRQMVLYALAFDPADDVPSAFAEVEDTAEAGALTGFSPGPGGADDWVYQNKGLLRGVTGSWLYMTDYALRNEGAGGLSMEGTQYQTNGLGPLALALTALHSAGQDDAARWGPQVSLDRHPFWQRVVPAYLAMLTPAPRVNSNSNYTYLGAHFQPALAGDLETYAMINDQFTKVLVPLALHDQRVNGTTGEIVQAVRYIQRQLAPGGPTRLGDRIRSTRSEQRARDAINYFLLFDPTAPAPADPRPALQPVTFWAQHDPAGKMGTVLARSDPTPAATYFHWRLAWNRIDHQRGDSLSFGLWKNGLWLTKVMTGYGVQQGLSDYRNAPALENTPPVIDAYGGGTDTQLQAGHGSQLIYESLGDPHLIARSLRVDFLHFDADATNLYNSYNRPEVRAIQHASRSLVWLKPDIIVVYDRAKSSAGLFKRFYLNLPEVPTITGRVAVAVAKEGATPKAKLFVTSLLPLAATVQSTDISSGQPSAGEDMAARLVVDASGAPAETRLLHVVQGTDVAAIGDVSQLVQSTAGTDYDGAVVGPRAILFKRDATAAVAFLDYEVPAAVTQHYITGLAPFAGYTVTLGTVNGVTNVHLVVGGAAPLHADDGGVLVLGSPALPSVAIAASALRVPESSNLPVTFTVSRSGDVGAPLTVALGLDAALNQIGAADVTGVPAQVTIPAGAASVAFDVTPVADAVVEGPEALVLTLTPGAGFQLAEAGRSATVTLTEAPVNSGQLQFASANASVAEIVAAGSATITVTRTGGYEGPLSVQYAATAGTATAGADFTATSGTLTWTEGDSTPRTFTVAIADDSDPENSETIQLSLSSPSAAGALGATATATLTIIDDENPPADGGGGGSGGGSNDGGAGGGSGGGSTPPAGTLQFDAATLTANENAGSVQLTVTRTDGSYGALSAAYTSAAGTAQPGSDYTTTSGWLNWSDGDTTSRTITVPILDDGTDEPTESFTLALSGLSGGTTGANAEVTISITDDDIPSTVYNVGPGQPLASLAEVPWATLPAAAKVRIHWRAQAYQEKILISTRGTAAQPIVVEGVAGPDGQLPVIDGTGATASPSLKYTPWYGDVLERSIVAVARNSTQPAAFKPGHLIISGLEITMTGPKTPMPTYVKPDGSTAGYYTTGGAIFLYGAEHVTIRDCVIHDTANGIVSASGSTESTVTRDLTVERTWLYHAGKGGSYHGSNLLTEGVGLTVQFSRLDRGLNGSNAANLSDRSAGTVIRYNWIVGGSKVIDLIEPGSSAPIVTADPAFAVSHVYGNILRNGAGDYGTDGSGILRYGGYYGSASVFRQGTLHFHHNTLVVDSQRWSTGVFEISLPAATVVASNNVIHHAKLTGGSGPFTLINSGRAILLGRNWITTGYTLGGVALGGTAQVVTGATPGFVNTALENYVPASATLIDTATALPADALPVDWTYLPEADGGPRVLTGAAPDLGALEVPVN